MNAGKPTYCVRSRLPVQPLASLCSAASKTFSFSEADNADDAQGHCSAYWSVHASNSASTLGTDDFYGVRYSTPLTEGCVLKMTEAYTPLLHGRLQVCVPQAGQVYRD